MMNTRKKKTHKYFQKISQPGRRNCILEADEKKILSAHFFIYQPKKKYFSRNINFIVKYGLFMVYTNAQKGSKKQLFL
jgi:hypothetical protein